MADSAQVLQFLFSGLTMGSMYALMALSLVIVYKVSKVICFAQGEFFTIGALMVVTLTGAKIPLPLAVLLAILISAILGIVIEKALIRPVLKSSLGNVIVMTIAISLAFRGGAMLLWGRESKALPPFSSGEAINIWGATLLNQIVWTVLITVVVLIGIWFFFEKTQIGLAMRANAENPIGASLVGINVRQVTSLAWAWGAALGALAGIVIAPLFFMNFASGVMPMFKGFVAMSIGGLNSNVGAVVAGFALGILEAFTIGFITSEFSDTVVFSILILFLLIRPGGLIGSAEGRSGGM